MKRVFLSGLLLSTIVIAFSSCKDMGNQVASGKQLLAASVTSVSLVPGGVATVNLGGGNPPYRIAKSPSATLASATLTNNSDGTGTVRIQAVSAAVSGRDSAVIQDTDPSSNTDAPLHEEQQVTIYIQVNPVAVLFSTQVQPIFTNNCVTGCHTSGGIAPFSLQTGLSRDNLLNRDMRNTACGGKRVVAGDADASGLVKKLEGNCGERMPLGGAALPSADITLIRDWINQGAPNN